MTKSKLKTALDARQGRDYKLEKQKKLQKQAAKRKKSKSQDFEEEKGNLELRINGNVPKLETESDGWESDESEAAEAVAVSAVPAGHNGIATNPAKPDTSRLFDSESDSDYSLESDNVAEPRAHKPEINGKPDDPDNDEEDEEDEDVPLSDIESLSSTEKADILPHQRLTINNTAALTRAHKSINLPYSSLPFSAHQTLTTASPLQILDINDDLNRELAFYKQCLDAANEGRALLKKEGVSFTRPNDYFAEMVKSDEHMGKIKQKMVDEAAGKKAAAEARRQRDLRKFGKQVQVAKLQERDKQKRETLDKISLLKRSTLFGVGIDSTWGSQILISLMNRAEKRRYGRNT